MLFFGLDLYIIRNYLFNSFTVQLPVTVDCLSLFIWNDKCVH